VTTPQFDLADVVPLKYKPLVGLVGSALTFIIPTVLDYSTSLPNPWPWVIAAVVALLTALGIYRAPYKPEGTVLVPEATVAPPPVATNNINVGTHSPGSIGGLQRSAYQNPWQ